MFVPSCLLLVLLIAGSNAQCPPLYEYVGGKCLGFFSDVEESFADASLTCQYFQGTLARIDDCHLLSDVAVYLRDTGIDARYWIDATDVLEEGTFIWSDGNLVPMGAPFWDSSFASGTYEPQEDDGEDCIAMAKGDGYYFHNEDCLAQYSPLCEQLNSDNGTDCTLPFISVAGGCYELIQSISVSWAQSRAICESRGGDLAIIDDCSDMADIIQFIETINPDSHVWIGGRRESSSWYWIDGSDVIMEEPFWGRDQEGGLEPNGGTTSNCVYISPTFKYRFLDTFCSNSYSPMCETPLLEDAVFKETV